MEYFSRMQRFATSPVATISALAFTVGVVVLGYIMLGLLPMLLFALGFVGGLLLWMYFPSTTPFTQIKIPYFLTLLFFVGHKWEERQFNFFPALSEITGVPVPSPDSILVPLLYAFAAAWLLIPFLLPRKVEFGYFLAWTFFASMGIIELAHFAFPLLTDGPYGYFPGMVSVVFLAPAAWWGMSRLMLHSGRALPGQG